MGGMAAVDRPSGSGSSSGSSRGLHSGVRIVDRIDGGVAMTIQWYVCSFVDVFGQTGSLVVPAAAFDGRGRRRHPLRRVRARGPRGVLNPTCASGPIPRR